MVGDDHDKHTLDLSYEFVAKHGGVVLSEEVGDEAIIAYFDDLSDGKVQKIDVLIWSDKTHYALERAPVGWTRKLL